MLLYPIRRVSWKTMRVNDLSKVRTSGSRKSLVMENCTDTVTMRATTTGPVPANSFYSSMTRFQTRITAESRSSKSSRRGRILAARGGVSLSLSLSLLVRIPLALNAF